MNDKAKQKRETPFRIEPGFSLYLDLVRVVAALDVMIAHAQLSKLIPPLPLILDSAPTAVVVVFVLSGYIIESTTQDGFVTPSPRVRDQRGRPPVCGSDSSW